MAAHVASVQFSRTVERLLRRRLPLCWHVLIARVTRASADAGLSKLNSMLDLRGRARRRPQVVRARGADAAVQPGSVDMLGPIRLDTAGLSRPEGLVATAAARTRVAGPRTGAPLGAP